MSRKEILKAHYFNLVKRVVVWIGFGAIIAAGLFPMTASATGELEPRSTQMSTSSPAGSAATTTYTFNFRPVSTPAVTIDAITFQICDSPIQGVACAQSAGASGGSFAGAAFSTTGQSAPFNATWATGIGGTCGVPAAGFFCISNASGSALNNATTYSVIVTGIQNPTTANTEFYTRITTWTNTAGTTPANGQDFGAEALSTGTQVAVSGLVQESLVFAVGSTGSCPSPTTSTSYFGGSSTSVLSSTAATAATAKVCVNTNAQNGYTLAFNSTTPVGTTGTFANQTGTSHSFNDCVSLACTATGDTMNAGTNTGARDYFGMSLIAATGATGDVSGGSSPSGGVSPTSYTTGYGTADTFNWANNAYTAVASETTGPSATETYTPLWEAQAAPTTNFGQYQVNVNFIATSSF